MAYLASGTLGAVAATLAVVGSVHLEVAAGEQSNRLNMPPISVIQAPNTVAVHVDRSAKGDRDMSVKAVGGATISFLVPGQSDSSVMVRMPGAEAENTQRKQPHSTIGSGKGTSAAHRPVACEPVVSVLSAAASLLGPGRCVT